MKLNTAWTMTDLFMNKGATFSECRQYRYRLWRVWDDSKPKVLFVMLNPSTADANKNDPTIRRCINYASDWGYGGLYVGNLFAYRATDPEEMKSADDPIGPENDWHLEIMQVLCDKTILAWGAHGSYRDRSDNVLHLFKDPKCLDLTNDGQPRHPLYLRKDLEPKSFSKMKFKNGGGIRFIMENDHLVFDSLPDDPLEEIIIRGKGPVNDEKDD